MKRIEVLVLAVGVCLVFAAEAFGQGQRPSAKRPVDAGSAVSRPVEPESPSSGLTVAGSLLAVVPRLMKFSGVLHDGTGKQLNGAVDVTFALYSTEAEGNPLWFETQSVQADELGRYTALLGAMHTEGLPVDLFTSGEVRWLGIQVGLEAEQPRVLLVSVPYALKAGDAETLGGKPASAYMLSDGQNATLTRTSTSAFNTIGISTTGSVKDTKTHTANSSALTACTAVTSNGAAIVNSIALFTSPCIIQSSVISQAGGKVGIGTTAPGATLHVVGPNLQDSDARFNIISTDTTAASAGTGGGITFTGYFSGTTSKASFANIRGVKENGTQGNYASALIFDTRVNGGTQTERMRISSAGNLGIGTTAPLSKIHVQDGNIRLARGGSYPAILDQSLGSIFTITNGVGKQLSFDYNGNLGVAGNIEMPQTTNSAAGVIKLGGLRFIHACCATGQGNIFVGLNSGNFTMTGSDNTIVGDGFQLNSTGMQNVAVGEGALGYNSSGSQNTASGVAALYSNFGGSANTALGYSSMFYNTAGSSNTAVGYRALYANTTGNDNTAIGLQALDANTTGAANTASGRYTLSYNTTGSANTADGEGALEANSTGNWNTAVGSQALLSNTTGSSNTAAGQSALLNNTTGASNAASGVYALFSNTTGSWNAAFGPNALSNNCSGVSSTCTGNYNIGVGYYAGVTTNTSNANVTGGSDTFLGAYSGPASTTQLDNATAVGARTVVGESNALVLGSINGVNGATASVNVGIGTSTPGKTLDVVGDIRASGCFLAGAITVGGTCSSDARLKTNIQPFAQVLDKVAGLQPVHFNWKATNPAGYDFGAGGSAGLIAQQVEKVFPDLVSTDAHGYKQVNYSELPFLILESVRELKAENDHLAGQISKDHAEVAKLGAENSKLSAEVDRLKKVEADMTALEVRLALLESHEKKATRIASLRTALNGAKAARKEVTRVN